MRDRRSSYYRRRSKKGQRPNDGKTRRINRRSRTRPRSSRRFFNYSNMIAFVDPEKQEAILARLQVLLGADPDFQARLDAPNGQEGTSNLPRPPPHRQTHFQRQHELQAAEQPRTEDDARRRHEEEERRRQHETNSCAKSEEDDI
jgi:hypothetical protein